jgi:DNA polymerase type B, organellar and viral
MHQQTYLLKRLKTTRIPERFIAIHHAGMITSTITLDYYNGLWDSGDYSHTNSLKYLWRSLAEDCQSRKTTWLVGWRMYQTLCSLGIYNELESGRVSVKKKRRKPDDAGDQSVWTQQCGAMICDSPPTIIDLDLGLQRYLRCIDLANWGLEICDWTDPNIGECLEDAVQALQDYVCMVRALKMGTLQSTAASQGYARFRTHDHKTKIAVHSIPEIRQLERRAYYGGRCECLQVGPVDGPLYYIDVKAMYSSIALTERFPTGYIGRCPIISIGPQISIDVNYWYAADVTISYDKPRYPCRINGHTYYPVGKYTTSLCGAELVDAVRNDAIYSYQQVAMYNTGYVWRDYARWYTESLNNLGSLGLDHMKGALKLAVNASYGKVGASGKRWIDCEPDGTCSRWGQWWREHPLTGEPTQGRSIDGIHQYLDTGGEPASSIPSLSAAMTSYGRVMLQRLIDQAGRDNVYYYDTDGLIVNKSGYKKLLAAVPGDGLNPGDLVVKAKVDNAWIGGIKHYRLGDHWVQAGVPADARRDKDGRATWDEHEPFAYGLWHGEPFHVRKYSRTRYGCRPYEHGTVRPDRRVEPLRADVLERDGVLKTVIYGAYCEIYETQLQTGIATRPSK